MPSRLVASGLSAVAAALAVALSTVRACTSSSAAEASLRLLTVGLLTAVATLSTSGSGGLSRVTLATVSSSLLAVTTCTLLTVAASLLAVAYVLTSALLHT